MKNISVPDKLKKAYLEAEKFARSHYENFPVISLLLPKPIRKHVAVVYKFARLADDIADEGKFTPTERINKLKSFRSKLDEAIHGNGENDFWRSLEFTIASFELSKENFYKLLDAFEQDITKKRYKDFSDLLEYCDNSANPVGRIILEFFDIRGGETFNYSDKICTALQLTNFYQDVKIDLQKGRIYIPQNEIEKYDLSENSFEKYKISANFKSLIKYQIERTKVLFDEGENLLRFLPGSLKRQIKWTILGGREILKKIENINYDVLAIRPKLTKSDYIRLMIKALRNN